MFIMQSNIKITLNKMKLLLNKNIKITVIKDHKRYARFSF